MTLLVLSFGALESGVAAPAYDDPKPQLYDLTARASEIDPNAREHPEIVSRLTVQFRDGWKAAL